MSSEQTDGNGMSCIDLHANCSPQDSTDVDSRERNFTTADDKSDLDGNMTPSSCEEHGNICIGELDPENPVRVRVELLMTGTDSLVVPSVGKVQVSDLHSDGTPVDVISPDAGEICTSGSVSPSTTASDLAEDEDNLKHQDAQNCYTAFEEKDKDDLAVILTPDYVIYRKTLYGEAQLMLSSDSILVKCLDTSGSNENFVLEWAVSDIIHTECQWSRTVDAALIKFHLRTTAVNGNENFHDTCDVVQLIIAVTDIYWLEKELESKFLQERYKGIWNVLHDDDLVSKPSCVERNLFFPRHYFTEIPDSFEDVIYPKGDPDAVSISRRDIELLQPDTFINDTIIDFYIKYLKTKIAQNERERFHFFNSFFFRKLADLDKDPGSASEGRAAFLRVRKWTRKLNLFEKDFIIIPVNFNLHWSLLIICHPGEIANSKDNIKDSPNVPCILHMDSIKGSHSGLKNLVQSYLWEEWKERHPEAANDYSSMFSNLRFVPLELPQQENSFDCGLFLLHYVELFLKEAPVNFSPFNIEKFSNFLTVDWFTPSEASFKRSLIRKLIYDFLNDPSQKVAPMFCCNDQLSSGYHDKEIDQKPSLEFLNQCFSPSETALDNRACSVADRKTKLDYFTSSVAAADFGKQGEAMYEFIEPGANSTPSPEAPFQKFKCVASPTEEHADGSELYISSSLDKDNCQPLSGIPTTQSCSSAHCPTGNAEYEISMNSIEDKEEIGGDLLIETMNSNHAVSDQRVEIEKQPSLEDSDYVPDSIEDCDNVPDSLEDCDNVPDSLEDCDNVLDNPISSSSENHEIVAENPQQNDTSKEEEGRSCPNSQAIEVMTEPSTRRELLTAAEAIDDHQTSKSPEAEVEDKEEHKKSQKMDDYERNNDLTETNYEKNTGRPEINACKEESLVYKSSNAVDSPIEVDVREEKDPNEFGTQTSQESQDNLHLQSLQDFEISDDAAKDGGRLKRGEPSTRIELHYQKRRKVLPPEGGRRLTRSLSRGRPS